MVFDRKTLLIPDKTKFDECVLVTKGDVVIGDRCLIRFGLKTDGRIFIGEHVIIDGDLDATNDIRIDIFSSIGGAVKSGGNVYLGEKVKVKGKLSLKGDLDVGDSVEIDRTKGILFRFLRFFFSFLIIQLLVFRSLELIVIFKSVKNAGF